MTGTVALTLNGRAVAEPAEPRTHLADHLREGHGLTGTHLGCEQGVCGACTVFLDGRPVRACITLAVACEGADVRTVEGFDDDPLMAQLRAAFTAHHALQCGYCTPGMLATAYDIVRRLPHADGARIRRELSGNLCRCTGYAGIVAAVEAVLAAGAVPAAVLPTQRATRASRGIEAVVPPQRAPLTDDVPSFDALPAASDLAGARTLTRHLAIAAPPDAVWDVVRDVAAMAACIPGAALDAPPQGEAFSGHVAVALGPMRARFVGLGALRIDAATRTGTVRGRGRDPTSRTALLGGLDFGVAGGEAATTTLDLTMTYQLKGPLAQFGRPAIVAATADVLLAETAAAIAARAGGAHTEAPPRTLSGGGFAYRALRAWLAGILRR